MIVEDLAGDKYSLTKTRLSEVYGRRYILLKEFEPNDTWVKVRYKRLPDINNLFNLPFGDCYIGCRRFAPETYVLIVKAAKALHNPKKKGTKKNAKKRK